jgi:hypothetical protein
MVEQWNGKERKTCSFFSKFACSSLTFIKKCQFCSQTCRWRCDFYKKSFFISSISFIFSDSPVIWKQFKKLTIQFYHTISFTCKKAAAAARVGGKRARKLKSRNQYFDQLSLLFNCEPFRPQLTQRVFGDTTIKAEIIWSNISYFEFHELAVAAVCRDCFKFITCPRGICRN